MSTNAWGYLCLPAMQLVSCPKPEKGHNLLSIQIDIAFTSREKESQPKN